MIPVPYTYLIGWSHLKKYYYGVRYAKNAHPSDLWVTYFTSSHVVKRMRIDHGDPDIIQIRKTFDDPLKAKLWEDRVLLSIPEDKRQYWLNTRFGQFAGIICTPERNAAVSRAMKGKNHTKGWTNEYRADVGMKLIPGKPKGAKDTEQSRKNKSESSKNYLIIKHLKTGKHERVLRDLGIAMIATGEYGHFMQGHTNKHDEETKLKLSQIAKNRPKFYCKQCDCTIQGAPNWDRHLKSAKHHANDNVSSDTQWRDALWEEVY